jgi:hypothetical protein
MYILTGGCCGRDHMVVGFTTTPIYLCKSEYVMFDSSTVHDTIIKALIFLFSSNLKIPLYAKMLEFFFSLSGR